MGTTVAPALAQPPVIQAAETEIQKIEVAVENVAHTVIVAVESGWQWVDGEFVYLKSEAQAAYQWVQKEDPQFAAYVRQLFLKWEAAAATAATNAAGSLGTLIGAEGDAIGTNVDNFAQALLGSLGVGGTAPTAKAAVGLLVSQGESGLIALVQTALAKAVGAMLPAIL